MGALVLKSYAEPIGSDKVSTHLSSPHESLHMKSLIHFFRSIVFPLAVLLSSTGGLFAQEKNQGHFVVLLSQHPPTFICSWAREQKIEPKNSAIPSITRVPRPRPKLPVR